MEFTTLEYWWWRECVLRDCHALEWQWQEFWFWWDWGWEEVWLLWRREWHRRRALDAAVSMGRAQRAMARRAAVEQWRRQGWQ